ncbi:hypothetical protein [Pantoea sp.]|uniref:hypothetical protein n=1 Tax=Pantoea sp. TaxID=69393 RepID=UPI0028AF8B85|nr:hypothetical protein [Pantoea sp.]
MSDTDLHIFSVTRKAAARRLFYVLLPPFGKTPILPDDKTLTPRTDNRTGRYASVALV